MRAFVCSSVLLALAFAVGMLWPRPEPVGAAGDLSGVSAGGYHACVLTAAGEVMCWGRNIDGQLGDGTTTQRTTPVYVCRTGAHPPCKPANTLILTGVLDIAGGGDHTCALMTTGGVKCWGRNAEGQLGDGTTTARSTPVDVCATGATSPCIPGSSNALTDVVRVASGGAHTCAVTTAGGVKCWGKNSLGQLGDGQTCGTPCTTPVDVPGLASGVSEIAAGGFHTCAVTESGGVKCWGLNDFGQLGANTTETCGFVVFVCSTTPVDVTGLSSAGVAVAAGLEHACALTVAGEVEC